MTPVAQSPKTPHNYWNPYLKCHNIHHHRETKTHKPFALRRGVCLFTERSDVYKTKQSDYHRNKPSKALLTVRGCSLTSLILPYLKPRKLLRICSLTFRSDSEAEAKHHHEGGSD